MSSSQTSVDTATATSGPPAVAMRFEVTTLPVADVDRAKDFYLNQAGFDLLVDHSAGDDFRVVQLTPPGSGCSIALMRDKRMAPGSLNGVHVIVPDIEAARAESS